jgi:hypothetical protein
MGSLTEEAIMELHSDAFPDPGAQGSEPRQWHSGIGIFQLLGLGMVAFSLLMVLFGLILVSVT